MDTTRTGNFPIGFRRIRAAWQQDIDELIAFAKQEGFGCIDLTADPLRSGRAILAAGLRIGSIDFPDFAGLLSPDADRVLLQNSVGNADI